MRKESILFGKKESIFLTVYRAVIAVSFDIDIHLNVNFIHTETVFFFFYLLVSFTRYNIVPIMFWHYYLP